MSLIQISRKLNNEFYCLKKKLAILIMLIHKGISRYLIDANNFIIVRSSGFNAMSKFKNYMVYPHMSTIFLVFFFQTNNMKLVI